MTHLIKAVKWSGRGLGILALIVLAFCVLYRVDNYMFGWEAGIYWGRSPFVSQQFREAATNEKSTMVADLISKKYFVGQSIEQAKLELGPSTGGYYNSDTNLAYVVRVNGETIWDVVFLKNQSTGETENILIYKRRGGITRKILATFMRFVDE
ncbi:MAG: hypothetical protein IPJ71_15695 [Bdellovibrionales bacterium]|nr:hypothetical protein [Bdellovibrionales bacterium]